MWEGVGGRPIEGRTHKSVGRFSFSRGFRNISFKSFAENTVKEGFIAEERRSKDCQHEPGTKSPDRHTLFLTRKSDETAG